jgi:hypothetical protein
VSRVKQPPSVKRVRLKYDRADLPAYIARIRDIPPERR